jgi:hypothetical protein
MKKENKLQIRNSTAEFLIFTRQAGEDGIEVRVADETVWLTQKLMGALFDVTVPTINEHLAHLYAQKEINKGLLGTVPSSPQDSLIEQAFSGEY